MDRSMKWGALLARIQSPSKELEAALAKSSTNLIEALSGLDELEALTQKHLTPPGPALPPAPAQSSPITTPATAATSGASAVAHRIASPSAPSQVISSASVEYKTSREEYAPALNQSALVEALLQYQRKKALRTPKPAAQPKTGDAKAAPASKTAPEFAKADFAPMRIPAIEAEPKASPLGRLDSPSVRLPVLRHKPSGNSNGNEQS